MAAKVLPTPRRVWTMAFVLATGTATNTTTAVFAAKRAKVDQLRGRVRAGMRAATDGLGVINPSGQVFVIKIAPPPEGVVNDADTVAFARDVAQTLYEQITDAWDFIAVYADYPDKLVGSRFIRAQNATTLIRYGLWDGTGYFRSGRRLLGVGLIEDVRFIPSGSTYADTNMQLLLHETIGHQYGVYHSPIMKPGNHFHNGLEAPCFSVMYGRPWRRIDDTHFRCDQARNPTTGLLDIKFHPWMMYMMGLKRRSEVPSRLMKISLDTPPESRYGLYASTGTFQWVYMTQLFGPPTAAHLARPPLSRLGQGKTIIRDDPLTLPGHILPPGTARKLKLRRRIPGVGPLGPN